mmetsp:Transcript_13004/g.19222  ORF Transcript_13004/g.19222 Transcript_13004/m.19222 type:complete len:867 (-) Transcript_13004:575-3175(-)
MQDTIVSMPNGGDNEEIGGQTFVFLEEEDEENTNKGLDWLWWKVLSDINTISRWIYSMHNIVKDEKGLSELKHFSKDTFQHVGIKANELEDNPSLDPNHTNPATGWFEIKETPTADSEETHESSSYVSAKYFPPLVEINSEVEASFRSLDDCLLTAINMPLTNEKDTFERVQTIVDSLAQVPSFMKTVLLIHRKVDRRRILSYKIVRRVMFSPFSIYLSITDLPDEDFFDDYASFVSSMQGSTLMTAGEEKKKSWLVYMLEAEYHPTKEIAVDYLELLSELAVVDFKIDEGANPTPVDVDMFQKSRDKIFSEVEGLKFLVPTMILLKDSEKERATTTAIIQRVLDNAIVQPFGITILFCDLIFNLFMLFGWRSVSFRLLDVYVDGRSFPNHLQLFGESMFFISTIYFSWRLIGEMLSTAIISWRVFKGNLLSTWTLINVISIVMAFVSFSLIMYNHESAVYSFGWFNFFSLLTGFLWLKLLNFLKNMNSTLAAFMLAIEQVLKDVLILVLILFVVTIAFGDMIYTIAKRHPKICPPDQDPDEDANPFCDLGSGYLNVFTQILGQFNYPNLFVNHPFLISLFITMVIFGAVIFLNILIAVVSDSYSKSCEKSARLFGRARLRIVSKIDALQHIIQGKWLDRRDTTLIRISKFLFKIFSLGSCSYSLYYISFFYQEIGKGRGSTAAEVIASIIMILFFIGSVILFLCILLGWGKHARTPKLKWLTHNPINTWIYWKPMVFIMQLVLGRLSVIVSVITSDENVDEDPDRRWSVPMKQIHSTINESVERSEQRLMKTINFLESRLKESERQRAEEIDFYKKHIEESEKQRVKDMDFLKNCLTIQDPYLKQNEKQRDNGNALFSSVKKMDS